MKRDVLEKANELTAEIRRLKKEIVDMPLHRLLKRYKYKAEYSNYGDLIMELTNEDIKALIDLRLKRVKELEKELEVL